MSPPARPATDEQQQWVSLSTSTRWNIYYLCYIINQLFFQLELGPELFLLYVVEIEPLAPQAICCYPTKFVSSKLSSWAFLFIPTLHLCVSFCLRQAAKYYHDQTETHLENQVKAAEAVIWTETRAGKKKSNQKRCHHTSKLLLLLESQLYSMNHHILRTDTKSVTKYHSNHFKVFF